MRIFLLLISLLTLIGCGNHTPKVTPNKLSPAISGMNYNTVINISGGYISERGINVDITPDNSGLSWSPIISYRNSLGKVQKDLDFHTITVSGTPLNKGVIKIKIDGFTSGTMYPGKEFHKIYNITVD